MQHDRHSTKEIGADPWMTRYRGTGRQEPSFTHLLHGEPGAGHTAVVMIAHKRNQHPPPTASPIIQQSLRHELTLRVPQLL